MLSQCPLVEFDDRSTVLAEALPRFTGDRERLVGAAILRLVDERRRCDFPALEYELARYGDLEAAGGPDALRELAHGACMESGAWDIAAAYLLGYLDGPA